MSVETQQSRGGYVDRPSSSSLADVVDLILDKGLVIDAYVRVSLVGIEILTVDARIVVASVDTYLRFAEATNRLDLYAHGGKDLPELTQEMSRGGARGKTSGMLDAAKDKVEEAIGPDDRKKERARRPRRRDEEQDE